MLLVADSRHQSIGSEVWNRDSRESAWALWNRNQVDGLSAMDQRGRTEAHGRGIELLLPSMAARAYEPICLSLTLRTPVSMQLFGKPFYFAVLEMLKVFEGTQTRYAAVLRIHF